MEESSDLVPTAQKAIFLLVIPPKSLFHDPHRCVQVQRVVHQTIPESNRASGLRIRPIFNLEYHKLFATRIIELEEDDAKVAEFHPMKVHHEDTEVSVTTEKGSGGGNHRRRRRAWSIDNKSGEFGGSITSRAAALGLCDMTVTGSEREGLFTFTCADGKVLEWRKSSEGTNFQWQLLKDGTVASAATLLNEMASEETRILSGETARPRMSYEFPDSPDPSGNELRRSDTSQTLSSAYTTYFNNESQLSGMTHSPKVDDRGHVNDTNSHADDVRAALHSYPVPHITVTLQDSRQPRHSMRQITKENHELYRILLCTLWITWSSPDFIYDPEVQRLHDAEQNKAQDVPITDRQSKLALSKASRSEESPTDDRNVSGPRARARDGNASQQQKRKKRGIFSMIAKICSE